jgi:hypothetical protein
MPFSPESMKRKFMLVFAIKITIAGLSYYFSRWPIM